ncbi:uncharacterized protein LOC121991687 isoform X2 [Zingiber officinale]|uniref:uncharacterized protein LOC121991687 isoform X2 n=1 Tax=Zingiber officinale TaxID=94328 RepID=UPI001C4C081B|nr:uncharacterized protein LOC121991687 isoform X2 [Zingiber officinale]
MEANSSEAKNAHLLPLPLTPRSPKRLLFDNRYGWIFDEWKDPSEEAYAGGRGMFCILPIAKSLVNAASHSALHRLRPLATLHIFRPRLLSCNHWNHVTLYTFPSVLPPRIILEPTIFSLTTSCVIVVPCSTSGIQYLCLKL